MDVKEFKIEYSFIFSEYFFINMNALKLVRIPLFYIEYFTFKISTSVQWKDILS